MVTYDMVITNGSRYDTVSSSPAGGNIFIKDHNICEPPPAQEDWESKHILDASNCYVVPGLIDEHAHVNYQGSNLGVNADILCPSNGITTVVDAGTTGCNNFELFYRANICRYVTNVLAYLNISSFGVECPYHREENLDPRDFDEKNIERLFSFYPAVLRGLKIRLDRSTLAVKGTLDSLEKCLEISDHLQKKGFHCPVVAHIANLPDDIKLDKIMAMLRPGDVFVHALQNRGETIFTSGRMIKQSVSDAQKRGVIIDCCNGRIHWSFSNLESARQADFIPDIISSDTVLDSAFLKPCFSLIHAMNTFLAAGFSEKDIIHAVTDKPAKVLGLDDRIGFFRAGSVADLTILKMDDSFPLKLFDQWGEERTVNRYFKPMATIRRGQLVFRQIDF